MLIGTISDTHGLLREEVFTAFENCDLILHAGDIGSFEVLEKLRSFKEVIAIRGNVDTQAWAMNLNETELITLQKRKILLIHNLNNLKDIHTAGKAEIVIYGHSHKADIKYKDHILFFNPGSAGPRRFSLPVSLGLITLDNEEIKPAIVNISTFPA
ncbi:MAG: metallophosphoesterase family protein [Methanococcaceae archaeon]